MDVKRTGTFKNHYNTIMELFKDSSDDDKQMIDGMVNTAAFAYSEMEKAAIQVQKEGAVVLFKNGKQEFLKKHPAFEIYTKLQTEYLATMKELRNYRSDDGTPLVAVKNVENPIDAMMTGVRDRKMKRVK